MKSLDRASPGLLGATRQGERLANACAFGQQLKAQLRRSSSLATPPPRGAPLSGPDLVRQVLELNRGCTRNSQELLGITKMLLGFFKETRTSQDLLGSREGAGLASRLASLLVCWLASYLSSQLSS